MKPVQHAAASGAANCPHANNPPYSQTRYRPAGPGFAAADPIHPAPPHPATDRGRQGFSKNAIDTMSYSPTLSGFRGDARWWMGGIIVLLGGWRFGPPEILPSFLFAILKNAFSYSCL